MEIEMTVKDREGAEEGQEERIYLEEDDIQDIIESSKPTAAAKAAV